MIEHVYKFRVVYSDTDQMGIMHHSVYAKYYESARWELFRSIGIAYQMVEEAGFILPVIRMNMHYVKTTRYDEQLTIKTVLKSISGVRIWFTYKMYNINNVLINDAETELAFINKKTWKPCAAPDLIIQAVEKNNIKYIINEYTYGK